MTTETVSYTLVALALAVGVGILLYFALQRGAGEGGGRSRAVGASSAPAIGNPEKQVAVSAMLIVVLFLLGLAYIAREPARMAQASQRQQDHAIEKGEQTYISLCVSCHGAHGEGGVGKPLNTSQFRQGSAQEMGKAHEILRKTISRGRPSTAMPAWAQDEGGPLNAEQVNQLVTLIQYGDWEEVGRHAAAAPAQPVPAPGSTGATASGGDLAAEGRQVYAAKGCAACHGATLQGGVGPALQHVASTEKIAGSFPVTADNLKKWIADPAAVKPGTAMPKLGLSDRELDAIVAFLMEQK